MTFVGAINSSTITGGTIYTIGAGSGVKLNGNDVVLYDDTTGGSNPVIGLCARLIFDRVDSLNGEFRIQKRKTYISNLGNAVEMYYVDTDPGGARNYIFLGRKGEPPTVIADYLTNIIAVTVKDQVQIGTSAVITSPTTIKGPEIQVITTTYEGAGDANGSRLYLTALVATGANPYNPATSGGGGAVILGTQDDTGEPPQQWIDIDGVHFGTDYIELFNQNGADTGWDIYNVPTGGGGFTAGDLNIIPQSSNATDTVRLGNGSQTCNLVVHGTITGTGLGTVTSVATSGAITGGTITTTGTISHSTSSGYNHVPSGGSSGQYLKYSSDGVATWASVSGGIPSGGTTYQMLRNDGSGSASWTSSLYVGASVSYAFYESGGIIVSTVGMHLDGNSTTHGTHTVIGEVNATNGSIHTTGNIYTGGYGDNDGGVYCAVCSGASGGFTFSGAGRVEVSNHFDPSGGGSYNTGGSTRYWNDVSYKTLTDRGCLGWFDGGVELQDGTIVSDTEAIKAIQKHPTKLTIYGMPMIDYKTLPKVSYKPAANHNGVKFLRDKDDEPKEFKEIVDGKEVTYKPQDGAEMTSIFSIMLGAIKELTNRIEKLENNK
jgi:hypothetical protein